MANKVVRPDGTVRVRIIGPGKGSSATYEASQLKRDGHVFKGAQVFLDHPSSKEERERPERSLRDLCGVAVSDPLYEDAGPAGAGLYSDVRVFKPYQTMIEEMGPHIGVSIRASGTVATKTVNGEAVRVAEKFTSGGFDFVTKAGAGGAVVPFAEASRSSIDTFIGQFLEEHPQESETSDAARALFVEWASGDAAAPTQEVDMAEQTKLTALETENASLKTENQRLHEAAVLREAQEIVVAEVAKETTLPEITRTRLVESLKPSAPMKEGKLDTDALKALIATQVKSEKAYLESLTKTTKITGMGATVPDDGGKKKLRESMVASFMARGDTKEKAEALADLAVRG